MSYSTCVKCGQMVPGYEKYCNSCVRRFGLEQNENFHKTSEPKPEPSFYVDCDCGNTYSLHVYTVCPRCHAWPNRSKSQPPAQEKESQAR